jgi:tetratricopeptide (TPR) repeat protein
MNHDRRSSAPVIIICLGLALATAFVYAQVRHHAFINYDDLEYIVENPHVTSGFTAANILWAFTKTHAANWHPLTWISHMLDYQLFGLRPAGHLLMNLFFHMMNTALLFLVLNRMTRALWPSAFVAALFALHPLHVESVAWIAERKDVLSIFFWMLTMGAYVFYVEKPDTKRYLITLGFFFLGLMAKPMLVTLPFVLLLLDYWPLGRLQVVHERNDKTMDTPAPEKKKKKKKKTREAALSENIPLKKTSTSIPSRQAVQPLLREKIPFFALTLLSSLVTLYAQRNAMAPLETLSMAKRISNALISYVHYIGKMIWPTNLAFIYPLPDAIPGWQVVGAAVLLAGITLLAIRGMKRFPYLMVGWLWYLGTLVPVIGLVQVGSQAMADRYTYVPLIGLFITAVWGLTALTNNLPYRRVFLPVAAGVLLIVLMAMTWKQVSCWKDSMTLFQHALNTTTRNSIAHSMLAGSLYEEGKYEEATYHYREAVRINPKRQKWHYNLGNALAFQGQNDEAEVQYREELRFNPRHAFTHYNLANLLVWRGQISEAMEHYRQAIVSNPNYARAHYTLGTLLAVQGKIDEAIVHFREALRIKPDFKEAFDNLQIALRIQKQSR